MDVRLPRKLKIVKVIGNFYIKGRGITLKGRKYVQQVVNVIEEIMSKNNVHKFLGTN